MATRFPSLYSTFYCGQNERLFVPSAHIDLNTRKITGVQNAKGPQTYYSLGFP